MPPSTAECQHAWSEIREEARNSLACPEKDLVTVPESVLRPPVPPVLCSEPWLHSIEGCLSASTGRALCRRDPPECRRPSIEEKSTKQSCSRQADFGPDTLLVTFKSVGYTECLYPRCFFLTNRGVLFRRTAATKNLPGQCMSWCVLCVFLHTDDLAIDAYG